MEDMQELFKFIDLKTGICKISDLSYKIKDLTVLEAEDLQDKEAAINEIDATKIKPTEVLQKAREWQEYILNLAFDNKADIKLIKSKLTASEFKNLIAEVFAFLGNFSGPSGALDFMNTLMEKQNYQTKN